MTARATSLRQQTRHLQSHGNHLPTKIETGGIVNPRLLLHTHTTVTLLLPLAEIDITLPPQVAMATESRPLTDTSALLVPTLYDQITAPLLLAIMRIDAQAATALTIGTLGILGTLGPRPLVAVLIEIAGMIIEAEDTLHRLHLHVLPRILPLVTLVIPGIQEILETLVTLDLPPQFLETREHLIDPTLLLLRVSLQGIIDLEIIDRLRVAPTMITVMKRYDIQHKSHTIRNKRVSELSLMISCVAWSTNDR
jgi:hypothetical protein